MSDTYILIMMHIARGLWGASCNCWVHNLNIALKICLLLSWYLCVQHNMDTGYITIGMYQMKIKYIKDVQNRHINASCSDMITFYLCKKVGRL